MNEEIIQSLGLSKKAAAIYLATLSLGTASIQQISQKSTIKRTSVYDHIDELLHEGFLKKVPVGKRIYYKAVNPEQIQNTLEKRVEQFNAELPGLMQLYAKSSGGPQVQILEGKQGIRRVYEECVDSPMIRVHSNLPDIEKLFYSEVVLIAEGMAEKKVRMRELMPNTDAAKRSSRRFASVAGQLYESRTVDGNVFNDMVIYNNVVAIVRIHELDLYVVRIEDETIATSMKTLYDTAWSAAKPYFPKQ